MFTLTIGGVTMEILRIILTVIFVIDCIALTVIVLMQEGKSAGLGAIGGGTTETFWSKNKGRSMEGALEKSTKFLAIIFIALAAVLNISF
jgi:preprotein translocase subunit SecG